MERRKFLYLSAGVGIQTVLAGETLPGNARDVILEPSAADVSAPAGAVGRIPVGFVVSDGAVVIDFAGPWEVLQDVRITASPGAGFELFTVAETLKPIRASGGLKIVPDFTFKTAPTAKLIIIPAQSGNAAMLAWIRERAKQADIIASVCTGAFILAQTGLLTGKSVATHHNAYTRFEMQHSDIHLVRGARYVDNGKMMSAGGLSSGIDLALHLVEHYFGRDVAAQTADQMEYQGTGWTDPSSNREYLRERTSTDRTPLCPVCGMEVIPDKAPSSVYQQKTYHFCSAAHKSDFDADPQKWAAAVNSSSGAK